MIPSGPLAGLPVAVVGCHPALAVAAATLRALGAERSPPWRAKLVISDALIVDDPVPDAGVPAGTIDLATGVLLAGASLLAPDAVVDRGAVARHLYLPALTGGAPPPAPVPAGAGFVCADLGADGDAEAYERLLGTLAAAIGPESLAVAAQEWRLPVTPYRARHRPDRRWRRRPANGRPMSQPARRALRVVDLTAMWSGPLATHLLAVLGATVVKVEPACRPDGLGAGPSALAPVLQRGKDVIDLDLRVPAERDVVLGLVRDADVVIDNWSRRVRANLGIGPDRLLVENPDLVSVSMPAFPAESAERDWVAYGTGIHAASGLGDAGHGRPLAPAVSYPDPLAGIAAFATVAAHLRTRTSGHVEVTLRDGVEPLLAGAGSDALAADPRRLGLEPRPHARMVA